MKLNDIGVKLQNLSNISKTNYSSFYLLLNNKIQRDSLIDYLKAKGISSQFHYIPLHNSPMGKYFKYNLK